MRLLSIQQSSGVWKSIHSRDQAVLNKKMRSRTGHRILVENPETLNGFPAAGGRDRTLLYSEEHRYPQITPLRGDAN
jgi:hypothetical protein